MFSFDPHFVPFNDHGFLRQVACITRLVPQKGLHLIRHAIYKTAELGGQFVLLGSSPVPHIQVCILIECLILFSQLQLTFGPMSS